MSIYNFAPGPVQNIGTQPYATWVGGFTYEQVQEIIQIGESKVVGRGLAGGKISDYRRSNISWLNYNDIPWLYDQMAHIARNLNQTYYQFDLTGFYEDFQFTIYEGDENGHYDWHVDMMGEAQAPRKLSMVLQLSDPYEYEGGDLEIMSSNTPVQIQKERGLVAVFPAYTLHRVTPVTSGIRRTLVVWCVGPRFK